MKIRRAAGAALVACLLGAVSHGPTSAQALRDPTRPPAALVPGGSGEKGAAAAAPAAPRLQSVLISPGPGGRRVAVIDGETVRLGDTYKGARLTRMTQDEVELVRGRERRVLKLDAPAGSAAAQDAGRVRKD